MAEHGSLFGQRVCVGLPSSAKDYDEMARLLTHVLADLGCQTSVTRDGDPQALSSDVLLLFGNGSRFTRYPSLLTASSRRPVTVLWHIEPLPPPVPMTDSARHAARNLARWDWNRMPSHWAQVAKALPGHNALRDAARALWAARFKHAMADRLPKAWTAVHARQLFHATESFAWFEQYCTPDWCDAVFVSTPSRLDFLRTLEIRGQYVPLGYHPAFGSPMGRERPVDVVFLGQMRRTARGRAMAGVKASLASAGVRLVVVTAGYYGLRRTELLNRAKVLIDLVNVPWEMPVLRLLIGMACGTLVVTNWTAEPTPFGTEHLAQSPTEDLGRTVLYYLEHEAERRRKTEAAWRFVSRELTLRASLSRILDVVHGLRSVERITV